MLDTLATMCRLFGTYYTDIIPMVIIMVSAIIVAIGFLKPFIFDKIKNKDLRRAVLALVNVGANFIASFLYFLGKGWNLKYYVLASLAMTVCSILTYYVYETVPGMRKFIGGIGNAAIGKIFNVGLLAATSASAEDIKAEIKNGTAELKANVRQDVKTVLRKVKVDKDLKNL